MNKINARKTENKKQKKKKLKTQRHRKTKEKQKTKLKKDRGSTHDVVINMLGCKVVVTNSNYSHMIMLNFDLILLGKAWTPFHPRSFGLNRTTTELLLQGWLWH